MKLLFGILVFMLLFIGFSCRTQKLTSNNDALIQLTKKRCFGRCPVYDIFIYKDGKVKYNGIENVKIEGAYQCKISKDSLSKLEELISAANLQSFEYIVANKKIRDLPVTVLKYKHREIKLHGNKMPLEIKKVIAQIENLVFHALEEKRNN